MRTLLAIAALAMLLSGCMASYPVKPNETLAPRASVTITFAQPRDLEARRDTAPYALRSIRKLYGRVEDVRSDTLILRVVAFESRVRQRELPGSVRLAVTPHAYDRITTRRLSRGRTAGAMFGVTVIGLFALLLANMELEFNCTSCCTGC